MVCPSCNRETQLDFFCHFCDVFLAQPRAGRRAGVSRRLAALFLDGILIWMVFGVVVSFSAILGGAFGEAERGLGLFLFTIFIAMGAYAIFALWFLAQGRTPGKWLLGIRAVDKTQGHAPGLGKMIVRETIGKFASGLVLGLGYLWAIWDRDTQAWHDKIASTVVLYGTPEPEFVSAAAVGTPPTAAAAAGTSRSQVPSGR